MKNNKIHFLIVAAAMAMLALPSVGLAQVPREISDSLTVYDPLGNIFAQVVAYEDDEDPGQIYYINDTSLVDPSQFGHATTLLNPIGNPLDGPFSDIFGVVFTQGDLFLAFSSDGDPESTPYGDQGTIHLPEGNGIFDATQYLNPQLRDAGYHAQFISDTEPIVPEPSALLLMGLGAVALGAYRRLSRKQK